MKVENSESIAHRVVAACDQFSDSPALIFPGGSISFGELRGLIAAFVIHFRDCGVNTDSVVFIDSQDPALAVTSAIATAILGARLVGPDIDLKSLKKLTVTHQMSRRPIGLFTECVNIPVDLECLSPATYSPEKRKAALANAGLRRASDPWLVVPTITSSDAATNMVLTQGEVVAQATELVGEWGFFPSRQVLVFPHIPGYSFMLRVITALSGGGAVMEAGPWGYLLQEGVSLLAIDATLAPTILQALSTDQRKMPVLEIIGDSFSNGVFSEASNHSDRAMWHFESAELGRIRNFAELEIDEAGTVSLRPTEDNVISDLGLVNIFEKHYGRLIETEIIGARTPIRGTVQMLGRLSGKSLTRGEGAINPSWIDAVLRSVDGIMDAVVFPSPKANGDELIGFVVFQEGVNRYQVSEKARLACRDLLGPEFVVDKLRPIDGVPRTQNGEPDRLKCAHLILQATSNNANL